MVKKRKKRKNEKEYANKRINDGLYKAGYFSCMNARFGKEVIKELGLRRRPLP